VNVTRAVLPVMRAQHSGLVVTISSTAGLVGGEFTSAYAASKFAVEGWIESLTPEVAPFGIGTMLVEPGFFRTDLLTPESTNYAEASIDDYAERTKQTVAAWNGMNACRAATPPHSPPRWSSSPTGTSLRCVGRRRRRRRSRRAEGQHPARPGRRPPRTVLVPRPRRRLLNLERTPNTSSARTRHRFGDQQKVTRAATSSRRPEGSRAGPVHLL
jgi:hypothetical protein